MWNANWKFWVLTSQSQRRICVPIWLIGKGFYFLDHWFIIIKGPNTEFCKSASGICFFHYVYTLFQIASSAVNIEIDCIQFSEIAVLLCQWLFISFSFCNGSFFVFCFKTKLHAIILSLLLLKNKPKTVLILNGNNVLMALVV